MKRTLKLLFLFLSCLFLHACSSRYQAPVLEHKISTPPSHHLVRKGETLYSIAFIYGLDYRALARRNKFGRPYEIFPGQKLALRKGAKVYPWVNKKSRKTVKKRYSKPKSQIAKSKKTSKKPIRKKPAHAQKSQKIKRWQWPSRGRVIKSYSKKVNGKKGIVIAGRSGQAVVAAAGGKVVYSGEGLPRYGRLIIIKHNETYLSAYAHNRRLLVKEGSVVKQGQRIAEMGRSGTDETVLHFEIRKNGKPINPLFYLPKR